MGKKQVFHSDDDAQRLPLLPSGYREFCGSDGPWSARVEHAVFFESFANAAVEFASLPIPANAGQSLARLQTISRLRSMLDAAEAVVLADGYELAHRDEPQDDAQEPAEDNDSQYSATCYGVDPGEESVIRSSFVAEVAIASRESERRAAAKLLLAEGLRHVCPATLAALGQGEITAHSAGTIVRQSQDLQPEQIGQLEQVLLEIARTNDDARVTERARKLREKMLPEAAGTRRERSESERSVRWWAEDDGMATLQVFLPVEDVLAIVNTIEWHAANNFADDERTEGQLKADIFRDALLEGWPEKPGPGHRVKLAVTVPALELLADPAKSLADLEGYGPIPAGVAMKLAAKAPSFARVLTDPWTGAPIDIGRTRYRPPEALREFIGLRDQHCRFPGCNRRADKCEVEHIQDWAKGGETCRQNNELTCKRHQMYKHALGWKAIYQPDGSVLWRSPHGLLQAELPGSITCAQQFDNDPGSTPPQPAEPAIRVDEKVRRVLGIGDPPPRPDVEWFPPPGPLAEDST